MSDGTGSPPHEPKTAILSGVILYRGTKLGWRGNPIAQKARITCTTTDPFVATLFAIECRNHGAAVVLLASHGPFERLIGPPNWFDLIESSVNVLVTPQEFAESAFMIVELDRSITILEKLGFGPLPRRMNGNEMLQSELDETHRLGLRLTLEQIDEFNQLILEPRHEN